MSVLGSVRSDVPHRRPLRARGRTRDRVLLSVALVALPVALAACENESYRETLQRVSGTEGANSLGTDILIRNARIANPGEADGEPFFPAGAEAPLLLHLVNNTPERDRLTEVSTPSAAGVTFGSAAGADSPIDIELPPVNDVAFTEEGPSLTLQGLSQPLGPGSVVEMTFVFETAPSVTLNVPVATPDERDERDAEDVHGGEHGEESEGEAAGSAE